jgi:D-xylulose kinase
LAAIDAGTTGERVAIFSPEGEVVAWKYLEHDSFFPKPAWVEQEAKDWWDRVCKASKTALREASKKGVTPEMIIGISVTNQRETVVPVDKSGKPLRRAIIWQDRRSTTECDRIKKAVGEDRVYDVTGLTVDPYFSAPKIKWIKEHEPNLYRETFKFLLVHDFLVNRLADDCITSWDNASRTMLFDIRKLRWSDELLDGMEIDRDKLPKPLPSGKRIGEVTRRASRETGFIYGTPVICGGGDQQCGALGVGVVKPGTIKATTGTGTFMLAFLKEPTLDPKKRVLCSCHCVPGSWVQEASIFSTGTIYRWIRDELSEKEKLSAKSQGIDPYELLNREASLAPPGSKGLLVTPHFAGAGAPHWNPYARGIIAGLAMGHTRKELVRAALEGIALEIRENIEVMKELGIPIAEMRVTGGASRNPCFNQIQADVYGLPVLRGRLEESTALGCAMISGLGTGIFRSVEDAAEKMVHITERYEPNPKNKPIYDRLFEIYKKIYVALEGAGVYRDLAQFSV